MAVENGFSKHAYDFGFLGAGIMFMVLGSMFYKELMPFAYGILGFALIANIYFMDYWLAAYKCGTVSPHWANKVGFIGTLLLLFYFGIQSPLIPLKEVFLVLSVILMIPYIMKKLSG